MAGDDSHEKDYYDVLGVSPEVDLAGLHEAYGRLSNEYASRMSVDPTARQSLLKLNEAYSVLANPDLRREYDRQLGLPEREWAASAARFGNPVGVGQSGWRPQETASARSLPGSRLWSGWDTALVFLGVLAAVGTGRPEILLLVGAYFTFCLGRARTPPSWPLAVASLLLLFAFGLLATSSMARLAPLTVGLSLLALLGAFWRSVSWPGVWKAVLLVSVLMVSMAAVFAVLIGMMANKVGKSINEAEQLITNYYSLVSSREYDEAYSLMSSHYRDQNTLSQFVENSKHVAGTRIIDRIDVMTFALDIDVGDSQTLVYSGWIRFRDGSVTAVSAVLVKEGEAWRIDALELDASPPDLLAPLGPARPGDGRSDNLQNAPPDGWQRGPVGGSSAPTSATAKSLAGPANLGRASANCAGWGLVQCQR